MVWFGHKLKDIDTPPYIILQILSKSWYVIDAISLSHSSIILSHHDTHVYIIFSTIIDYSQSQRYAGPVVNFSINAKNIRNL